MGSGPGGIRGPGGSTAAPEDGTAIGFTLDIAMGISAGISKGIAARGCRGCCRGGACHGHCRGECRGRFHGAFPWWLPWRGCRATYHGNAVGSHRYFYGTCCGHNFSTCRGNALVDGNPWVLPWQATHGKPRLAPAMTADVPWHVATCRGHGRACH